MPRAPSTATRTQATPYDLAEHLRTPEEMAAYLDAWLEETPDDASGIAKVAVPAPSAHCRRLSHAGVCRPTGRRRHHADRSAIDPAYPPPQEVCPIAGRLLPAEAKIRSSELVVACSLRAWCGPCGPDACADGRRKVSCVRNQIAAQCCCAS